MMQRNKPAHGAASALACAFLCSLNLAAQSPAHPLPDGKGKAEFIHNCTACHRAEMVTRHPKTPEEWRKSVDDMAARGTDGTKEDLDNVVLYLVTNYGKADSTTPSTTPAPTTSPSPQQHLKQLISSPPL